MFLGRGEGGEVVADEARFGGTDDGGEGVEGGFGDTFHALEVAQEGLLCAGTDAADGGKFAYDGRL